jgi:sialic acid synthase SpsE
MNFNKVIKLGKNYIGSNYKTIFIAEIGSNFDGNLKKAKDLIYAAKEAGADVAKFQHYAADSLVSDIGFKQLKTNLSHQKKWKGSVYDVYKKASLNKEWTKDLYETCKKAKILFMTSAYSIELADYVSRYQSAYKIGSGDITWHEELIHIAKKKKPVLLATGASTLKEVVAAVKQIARYNKNLVLMQCNTNYTNAPENLKYLNLSTIKNFQSIFPNIVTGLSDHTQNDDAVLAAVSLGARVIERHFTDSTKNVGPDHSFSTDIKAFKKLVNKVRDLESMLGDGIKRIEKNEKETIIVQRRSLFAKKNIKKGEKIKRSDLIPLRPYISSALSANLIKDIIGRKSNRNIAKGHILKKKFFYKKK